MDKTIYIELEKTTYCKNMKLTLGDMGTIYCSDEALLSQVKAISMGDFKQSTRIVISIMYVIKMIHKKCPQMQVVSIGENSCVAEYQPGSGQSPVMTGIKIAIVSLITFCGSAFAIMAYNNDVSATDVFDNMYQLVMGREADGFNILQLAYCIGLPIGILIFYNHLGKRKQMRDPTPMEVQMRTYENEVSTAVIEITKREGEEVDIS